MVRPNPTQLIGPIYDSQLSFRAQVWVNSFLCLHLTFAKQDRINIQIVEDKVMVKTSLLLNNRNERLSLPCKYFMGKYNLSPKRLQKCENGLGQVTCKEGILVFNSFSREDLVCLKNFIVTLCITLYSIDSQTWVTGQPASYSRRE